MAIDFRQIEDLLKNKTIERRILESNIIVKLFQPNFYILCYMKHCVKYRNFA